MARHIIDKGNLDISNLKLHIASSVGSGTSKWLYALIRNDKAVYLVISGLTEEFSSLDAAIDAYNAID